MIDLSKQFHGKNNILGTVMNSSKMDHAALISESDALYRDLLQYEDHHNLVSWGLDEWLVLGEEVGIDDVEATQLSQALEIAVLRLQEFASDSEFEAKLQLAFGNAIPVEELRTAFLTGNFGGLQRLEVRSAAEINGALGAYAAATDTIYLSRELLEGNADSPEVIAEVFVEEFGHFIDNQYNGSDSLGDEGEIFSILVEGGSLNEQELKSRISKNDAVIVLLDNQSVEIEQNNEGAGSIAYTFDVVAKTGTGFQSLSTTPSLNDEGDIAFVATASDGIQNIYVANGDAEAQLPINVSQQTANSFRFFRAIEINNNRQVLNRDQFLLGSPQFQLRVWDADNPGFLNEDIVAANSGSSSSDLRYLGGTPAGFASINNNGDVVFQTSIGSGLEELLIANSELDLGSSPPTGGVVDLGPLRPKLADNGQFAVRLGGGENPSIRLYEEPSFFGGLNIAETIATSDEFSELGISPGISDDGRVVAFYGNSLTEGPGIYVWVDGDFPLGDQVIKVTGVSNEIASFDPDSRIAINTNFLEPALGSGQFTVAYNAFNLAGNKGLYTSRFRLNSSDPIANFPLSIPEVTVSNKPILVVQKGDNISGLGNIQDIGIYDSVNNRGQIAFWAETDTEQEGILRAEARYSILFRSMKQFAKDGTWSNLQLPSRTGSIVPGLDHVALKAGAAVYEAHPGYDSGQYYDPYQEQFIDIQKIDGVQQVNTIGSFFFNSQSPTLGAVEDFLEIPITIELGMAMETIIQDLIQQRINGSTRVQYPDPIALDPTAQKGFEPNFEGEIGFTCVGLIEHAAELAGHNNGQGFVPNAWESITIANTDIIGVLSPSLQYYAATHPDAENLNNLDILQIAVDPVDFILTDPLGRRLGYVNGQSYNEIPDALYTGDGDFEQVAIIDPINGSYNLELFGLESDAFAAIDSLTSEGAVFSGFLSQGETVSLSINVLRDTGDINYSIATNTPTLNETDSGFQSLTFTITRSGSIQDASSVDYTIAGTATNSEDYNISSGATTLIGTINFAIGETEKTITVDVLGDTNIEPNESIDITLSNGIAPNGTATISVGSAQIIIENDDVANQSPIASTSGPYTVNEGSSLLLDGTLSNDPDQPSNSLNYEWDLDSDGTFGETGADATLGDETGSTATFDATTLDGPDSRTISLRVTDADGLSDTTTTTIDIQNVAPTVNDQTFTLAENSPNGTAIGTPTATDPGPDTLTFAITDGNSNGAFAIDPNTGEITIADISQIDFTTPSLDLTVTISDSDNLSDTAIITINLNTTNSAPNAVNDAVTTDEDIAISGNVLDGSDGGLDTDPDGDSLTVIANSAPTNGSVTVNPNGSFTYTPDTNFNGTDNFNYTISDGNGGTDTGTVTVTVASVNDTPIAVDDSVSTEQGMPISGNVLDGSNSGLDFDIDGDSLTVVTNTDPANGSATISADGSFTYTPNPNFVGTDTLSYTISDSNGGTDTATVTIQVTDNEVPPTPDGFLLTINNDITVNGVTITDQDIAQFNGSDYSIFFDGSDVGIPTTSTINAFDVISENEILLSFSTPVTLPGLGLVDDSDIVQFTATSLGETTAGNFALMLDGSDVGLSSNGEDIDAIMAQSDGSLLISTTVRFNDGAGTLATNTDIVRFTPTSTGTNTAGSFELFLDSSDIGLDSSNINGFGIDAAGDLFISTAKNLNIGGQTIENEDIFSFTVTGTGENTTGNLNSNLFFDGSDFGLNYRNIGGIDLTFANFNSGTESLSLSLNPTSVTEGSISTATITRTGDTSNPLTVNLSSSDPTEATVIDSITIGAGQTTATFDINAVDDTDPDGTQTATITASATGLTSDSAELIVTDNEVPPANTGFLLSVNTDITLNGVSITDQDIAQFNGTDYSLFFDGSDVGIPTTTTINAFDMINENEILLSFSAPVTLPGVGLVDDSDIVQFTATSLGETTAGTFALILDGSDVGLSSNGEDIDAIVAQSDGSLLISTTVRLNDGNGTFASGTDIVQFTPTSTGADTAGSFELFLDSSDIGLDSSNINGFGMDAAGDLFISTAKNLNIGGQTIENEDIFAFTVTGTGQNTTGNVNPDLFFDGSEFGLNYRNIRGLDLTFTNFAGTPTP